ncbi:hypothetical protein A6R68_00290, partial [Neotoma lepida]
CKLSSSQQQPAAASSSRSQVSRGTGVKSEVTALKGELLVYMRGSDRGMGDETEQPAEEDGAKSPLSSIYFQLLVFLELPLLLSMLSAVLWPDVSHSGDIDTTEIGRCY